MDHKDKDKKAVSGEDMESYKEKMKRSLLGSSNAEVEPKFNEVSAVVNFSSSPTMRECDICGKIFNGGKALGGHRRSHFQKNQKKVLKVRFTSNTNSANSSDHNNDVDDNGKTNHVCCICKKVFPTKNALFGHMRSHPERSWRGVSPPSLSLKPSSSSSFSDNSSSLNSDSMEKIRDRDDNEDETEDGCVGDGENSLVLAIAPQGEHRHQTDLSMLVFSPRWVKKDKRGRKCIGAYEAAETLAYISAFCKYYYGQQIKVSPKKDGGKAVLPKSSTSLIKLGKRKIGESSRGNNNREVGKKLKFCLKGSSSRCGEKVNGCNKGTLSESGVETMNMDYDVEGGVDVDEVSDDEMINGEKKVKKVDLKGKGVKKLVLKSKGKDAEYESGNKEKVDGYKCAACGKVFSTFQGLGGHRSIHKGKNIVIMDEPNHSDDAVAEENISSTSSNMEKVDGALLSEETGEAGDEFPDVKEFGFDLNEVPNNNLMEE